MTHPAPDDTTRAALARLVELRGVQPIASALGISREALVHYLAGRARRGTELMIALRAPAVLGTPRREPSA